MVPLGAPILAVAGWLGRDPPGENESAMPMRIITWTPPVGRYRYRGQNAARRRSDRTTLNRENT